MPDDTLGRWSALLDELERDLPDVSGELGATGPWQAPADLGPLPQELRGRAQALASRQAEAIADLEAEQNSTARHLAALRTVPPGRDDTRPIYLDTNG